MIAIQSAPTLSSPSPVPKAPIPCNGKCLAGIAIGDDKYRVLRNLESQVLPGSDERVMGDFNSYPDGTMLAVYYEKNIVAVSISNALPSGSSKIADPYGVKLGDTSDQLKALRGTPDIIDGSIWRYGTLQNIHWDYTVANGVVTTILLNSLEQRP